MKIFDNARSQSYKRDQDPFIIQSGRFGRKNIGEYHRVAWSEESYITDNRGRETLGRNFNISKLPYIATAITMLMLLIFSRTAWLQINRGDYYSAMAEGNRIRIKRIEPRRGIIYDRDMKPLVRNKADFMLYIIPADLPDNQADKDKIVSAISKILGDKHESEINDMLAKININSLDAYQPLSVAENIPYEAAMKLYLQSSDWPGVVLNSRTDREYPVINQIATSTSHLSLSHILGYTGGISPTELERFGSEYSPIDTIGKTGIEQFWENDLRGEYGKKHVEVDALGKEKKIIRQIDEVDGNNILLSIDLDAQNKLEEILNKYLDKNELAKASGIVLNPNSGEILAIVSLPAFDNNKFAQGISQTDYEFLANDVNQPLFNRSVSGEYPSGSTIKPVIAAAALAEGVISENTTFLSTGGLRISQWFFPDWRAGGHGRTDVRWALADSVNTFFYIIGGGYEDFVGLGVDKIVSYCKLFGLGQQTGLDLNGEAAGFLPSSAWKEEVKGERWYIGDTYHLAIGQGDLLVTPLQVAAYTAVFANGGKLYRPHLVKAVFPSQGTGRELEVEPVRSGFIDPYIIEVVRQGMRMTVTDGSAQSLQSVPVPVAGKTGTAQWSSQADPHAWFTGFAPYDDPEIVLTVLMEEGTKNGAHATAAVNEFLTWYFGEHKQ